LANLIRFGQNQNLESSKTSNLVYGYDSHLSQGAPIQYIVRSNEMFVKYRTLRLLSIPYFPIASFFYCKRKKAGWFIQNVTTESL